ncbi:hypothetical protein EV200_10510 [Pedobacter psychrotolerans]|uniref:Uncharacterized protein n=1 Tax=Pedobacter psychrotolerans TaxID=1843235 RepID=A0A4R2HBA5_9SPHI|nr:hypothetical protein EV200_10510 [Pedobacter psychrotolerans]
MLVNSYQHKKLRLTMLGYYLSVGYDLFEIFV